MATQRDTPAPSADSHSPAAHQAFLLLRTVFTVAPIVFGLDKFFDLLTDWPGSTWPRGSTPWCPAPPSRQCMWSARWRSRPGFWSRCARGSAATSWRPGWPASSSTCC